MLSQSTLIERFSKGAESGSASNVFVEDDVIYSYGHHFPLAIRQDWGADIRYIVNGDRYSASTSAHQSQCIRELTPNVQVPFSALKAARLTDGGLPKWSLRIAACRDDDYHRTCTHCGATMVAPGIDTTDTLALDHLTDRHRRMSLYALGLREGDVISIENASGETHFEIGGR